MVRDRKSAQFRNDNERGKNGERIIKRFHSRIDYNKQLPGFVSFFTDEGSLAPGIENANWCEVKGNNENRDFVAHDARDGTEMRHEVKTDYQCHLGSNSPTGNLYVEVDLKAIENLEEVKRTECFRPINNKRGYYNPNAIGADRNADYYHFLLALYERDTRYQEHTIGTRASELTATELETFRQDESIPECDSILASTPIETGLILTNVGLKHLLEKYARIKWTNIQERSNERCGIVIPISTVIRDIKSGKLKGNACITSLPETIRKNPKSDKSGHVWITKRMFDAYAEEVDRASESYIELANQILNKVELIMSHIGLQIKSAELGEMYLTEHYGGGRAYTSDKGWIEPFNMIDELKKLRIYIPDASTVKI